MLTQYQRCGSRSYCFVGSGIREILWERARIRIGFRLHTKIRITPQKSNFSFSIWPFLYHYFKREKNQECILIDWNRIQIIFQWSDCVISTRFRSPAVKTQWEIIPGHNPQRDQREPEFYSSVLCVIRSLRIYSKLGVPNIGGSKASKPSTDARLL